jgi:hypothetical protein
MPTRYRARTAVTPHRGRPVRRPIRPQAGQCFEIHVAANPGGWSVRVPEIDAVTEAATRTGVELAARELIAARTGIPIGYISVWTRD